MACFVQQQWRNLTTRRLEEVPMHRNSAFVAIPFAVLICTSAYGQNWSPSQFSPVPNTITPFGYGSVSQYLAGASAGMYECIRE